MENDEGIPEGDIKEFQKELTEEWEKYFGVMSQCSPILKDWLNRFVEKIRRGDLSIEDCRSQLDTAAKLLDSIHNSLDSNADDYHKRLSNESEMKDLWHPPRTGGLGKLIIQPENWNSPSPINLVSLDHYINVYLGHKELQHNLIDWCLVNALIFHELATYGEAIDSGELFGKIDYAHLFSGGEPSKWLSYRAGLLIAGFLLRWIIPPSIIFALFHFENNTAALYFGGAYALYLAC